MCILTKGHGGDALIRIALVATGGGKVGRKGNMCGVHTYLKSGSLDEWRLYGLICAPEKQTSVTQV